MHQFGEEFISLEDHYTYVFCSVCINVKTSIKIEFDQKKFLNEIFSRFYLRLVFAPSFSWSWSLFDHILCQDRLGNYWIYVEAFETLIYKANDNRKILLHELIKKQFDLFTLKLKNFSNMLSSLKRLSAYFTNFLSFHIKAQKRVFSESDFTRIYFCIVWSFHFKLKKE